MENLTSTYEENTVEDIKKTIDEWERVSEEEETDIREQQSRMEFILDPGSTRRKFSLFQQSVQTYWKIKRVLAKTMMSL